MAKVDLSNDDLKKLANELLEKHNTTYANYREEIETMLKKKFFYRVIMRMKTLEDWHEYLYGNFLKMDAGLRFVYFENDLEFIQKLSDICSMGQGCTLDDRDLAKIKTINTKYVDSLKETV